MATYQELFDLKSDDALRNRVSVAVTVKAEALMSGGTPTANEIAWASNALDNPQQQATKLLSYVLAANKDASVGAITGASDNAVQNQINSAVDALIAGGVVS